MQTSNNENRFEWHADVSVEGDVKATMFVISAVTNYDLVCVADFSVLLARLSSSLASSLTRN